MQCHAETVEIIEKTLLPSEVEEKLRN